MIFWQGLDIFSDIVFFVDIFFQSLSAYWRCDPMNGKWFLVDRPTEIRYFYLRELRPVCYASAVPCMLPASACG